MGALGNAIELLGVNREPLRYGMVSEPKPGVLVDRLGRVHHSLRISVTDACNIRCRYCMPEKIKGFMPQDQLLSFASIATIARILAGCGVNKVRLTGGEPLMRPGLVKLVQLLAGVPGLQQIAMTTNGMMLTDSISALAAAGLTHINISLDTLREETFRRLSRREGLDRVLAGIDAAVASGLPVRLNTVVLRDINLDDCVPLVRFALERGVTIRFIEFMPLDADRAWSEGQVITGRELREHLEREVGPLIECERIDPSQPSRDYRWVDGSGAVGFIDPVSAPFCGSCNRLRLTADGKFRNCLFGREEWDVRALIDRGSTDAEILDLACRCIEAKHASHGISEVGFEPPQRAMYQIGG
jgi:cyclic pyranopterin phosphate synthase